MPDSDHKQALPPGFRLGSYRVVRVLGAGGFGVTYLCEHTGLRVQVAVKEYLPNEIAVREGVSVHPKSTGDREGFEWGLSRFLDEARTLTRFEHRNLVRVRDCFEANNTAYIVMDYEEGESLDRLLQRLGTLTEAQLKRVLLPVADGLRQVHAAGFLHRDIKPSNIFVRRADETPVLLDFGSARQALGRRSKSVTAIASAGYSPPEQYESDRGQGPWTDIYALGALCYRAITGKTPVEAPSRQGWLLRSQRDPLPSLAETVEGGYSPAFLEAVDWGLRVIETERPQSLDEWLAQLGDAKAAGRRTGGSKPSETADRPATQKSGGFGAKVAWLVSATAAIGVALYFALAYWPQGSGQDQGTASESAPSAAQPRRSEEVNAGGYRSKAETVRHDASEPITHRVESKKRLEVGDRFRDCPECPEMVVVPSGSFLMGAPSHEEHQSDDEGPVHRVTIGAPFAVGVYEVTVAEFGRFVDETSYRSGSSCLTLTGGEVRDWWGLMERWGRGWRYPGSRRGDSHPVVCVSWDDARSYAAWLSRETGASYRLPSESEWEYVARAGTPTARYWGDGESGQCAYANGADTSLGFSWGVACNDGHAHTAPVGSYGANAWGLHDVLGNVVEWTEDCWHKSYAGAPSDGRAWWTGECDIRVLRGGAWYDVPRDLRSAARDRSITATRLDINGFRVARTFTP